ncbi:MAG: formylglycine-generating enzyme family protein [Microbacterium sp.]
MTGFVELPGGAFRMGSDRFYPEEGPQHETQVGPFGIAPHAVTNAEFRRFVEETGYTTVAERPIDPDAFPGAADVEPGSLVFTPTTGPVDLRDWRQWWRWETGASWRRPRGADSDIADDHPVVQVAYDDAVAYAQWAGARLPTEAEWEFAARGGLDGATFVWGEEPNDGTRANTWQGRFPYRNDGASGWVYTAPVGSFPANGYGLHEMTGNTWEWTSTPWTPRHRPAGDDRSGLVDPEGRRDLLGGGASGGCGGGEGCTCSPSAAEARPGAPAQIGAGERVLKGGSHLCAPEYCLRYRPAARSAQSEDSATTHIGFRLARDA